jgi:hypothetical protein
MRYLFWFSALAIVAACVPSVGAPVATVDPNQINVFIAQTANAARTQTAAAMPTSTATQLPTQTPANTFTPSPTFTSTVIFILASPTVPATITPTFFIGGGGGTSSSDYACQVLSVSPANGTVFDARTDFDAVWQVKNIGKEDWDHNSIDYSYDNGTQMHRVDAYDLSSDVRVGRTIDLIVDMRAPREAGSYRTTWEMRNSGNKFCRMSLTINVR